MSSTSRNCGALKAPNLLTLFTTGQVPISYLIQQCAGAGLCAGEFERVKDWITVLEKVGLLLLRTVPHPALAGQTMTVVSPDSARCRSFLVGGEGQPQPSEPGPVTEGPDQQGEGSEARPEAESPQGAAGGIP